METIQHKPLGPHVTVTPDGLAVDFSAIRHETIDRYGFAEKPAGEPWLVGKLSQADFWQMKADEQAQEAERSEATIKSNQ